jgi:serine/threonine protein kinase/Tol biopolymer transport system component
MVDWIGGTIGNYRVEGALGTGGMGRVFRAVHIHINRTVALKVLHDQHSTNETFQARFLREAQAAAALKHPNVVDVIDFNDHEGVYYLVMEFVPDGSLRSLLKQQTSQGRTLPLGLGLDLIRQAADGLHYAHQHGMVHRDIKPDNLLLQRNPASGRLTLKIADFGLAHLDSSVTLTAEGQTMGTPAYMSPEQCQGIELDSRSDIYSLGVVLYEVVTGMVPFDSRSLSEAVYKHVYAEPRSPLEVRPDLPPDLAAIILRCLAKDPNGRFSTAGELAAAIRAVAPAAVASSDAPAVAAISSQAGADQLQVQIDQAHLFVTPGEPAELTITLANTGATPLRATVYIEGVPDKWISTPPRDVELAPGAQVSGPVRVRVPRDADGQPGHYAVTVHASAADNPAMRAAAQAQITIQSSQPPQPAPLAAQPPQVSQPPQLPVSQTFTSGSLALVPGVAGARRSATYDLTLHNSSNMPQTIAPDVRSDDPTLEITVDPAVATVDPGQTTTVRLNVAAPPRWFGRVSPKYFQVGGGGGGLPPVRGQFVQQPFFPFWIIPVLVLALLTSGVVVAANLLGSDDVEPVAAADTTPASIVATPTQLAVAGDPTTTEGGTTPEPVAPSPTATEENGLDATPTGVPVVATEAPTETTAVAVIEPTATEEPAPAVEIIAFSAARDLDDPDGQLDIYIMDPDGSNQRPLISEPDDDWLPAWSPDGEWIAWVSRQHGNHQLYLAYADGSEARRISTSAGDDLHPAWSPDGRYILFQRVVNGNENLILLDLLEGSTTWLTDDPYSNGYAVWSPDGQQIAWSSNRAGQNDIYAMDVFAENPQPVRLTDNPAYDYNPVWSPDGTRIAWVSNRGGSFDIHMMFADGSNPTRWTSAPQDDLSPAWSPDGDAIAYVRTFGNAGHLYVLRGGIERPLATNASPSDPGIRWSPDGTRIAYVSEDTGFYDIWIVALDGSEPVQLTDHELNDANIAWYPAGAP